MAWFTFTDASRDVFVIRLDDPELVAHARALLSGATSDPHVAGTVVTAPVATNIGWSYHLDPASIFFFEMSTEVGDATMRYIETHLDDVGGAFLPDSRWTGWSSELTGELRFRGGTGGDDVILGRAAAELMLGRGGHDRLEGRGGDDHLAGGEGWDHLRGGDGADRLDGGAGSDVALGGDGRDLVIGGSGADWLAGGEGNDRLRGGSGADEIRGGAGDDRIDGGAGNDVIVLRPGDGHDRIVLGDEAGNRDVVDLRAFDLFDLAPAIDLDTGDVTIGLAGGDRLTLAGYAETYGGLGFGDNLLL